MPKLLQFLSKLFIASFVIFFSTFQALAAEGDILLVVTVIADTHSLPLINQKDEKFWVNEGKAGEPGDDSATWEVD